MRKAIVFIDTQQKQTFVSAVLGDYTNRCEVSDTTEYALQDGWQEVSRPCLSSSPKLEISRNGPRKFSDLVGSLVVETRNSPMSIYLAETFGIDERERVTESNLFRH